MSGSALLVGGLTALVLAIAALAVAAMPERQGHPGVARALVTIQKRYTRDAVGGADKAADPLAKLPGWLQGLAVKLSPAGIASTLQRRLDVAGNPEGWSPDRILAVKGLGLMTLALIGSLYGLRSPGLLILCAGLGGAIGFFLPDLLLYNSGLKRQQRIPVILPDAIDMLTICVEAGLGFDAALAQVARNTKGPLAAEFARALQEMQIGKSRSEALRGMADRTTVPELRAFVSALVQSGELGIPVSHVLREQAKEMRVRRRQRAEELAQKVPVKITFPLITCLFPALLVIIIGPGIIEIAHSLFGK
jgi:tight adherence protein C